jgi:hypothetical protein
MKRIVFIIVLIILLKPTLPVLEYAFNYDYISRVLCVNKENPKLHCNGKCHLKKELAKFSENEKPISQDKKTALQEFEFIYLQDLRSFEMFRVYFHYRGEINSNYSNLYSYLNGCSVFHPPLIISYFFSNYSTVFSI